MIRKRCLTSPCTAPHHPALPHHAQPYIALPQYLLLFSLKFESPDCEGVLCDPPATRPWFDLPAGLDVSPTTELADVASCDVGRTAPLRVFKASSKGKLLGREWHRLGCSMATTSPHDLGAETPHYLKDVVPSHRHALIVAYRPLQVKHNACKRFAFHIIHERLLRGTLPLAFLPSGPQGEAPIEMPVTLAFSCISTTSA